MILLIYCLIRTYGAKSCSACPAGQYSLRDMQSCLPCNYGYFSNTNGTANCTACPSGYFSDIM